MSPQSRLFFSQLSAAAAKWQLRTGIGGPKDAVPTRRSHPAPDVDVTGKLATSAGAAVSLLALEAAGGRRRAGQSRTGRHGPGEHWCFSRVPDRTDRTARRVPQQRGRTSQHPRDRGRRGRSPSSTSRRPPYGKYEYKFERPGMYIVGCDIHSTMRADILITATPYTPRRATGRQLHDRQRATWCVHSLRCMPEAIRSCGRSR